jgi:hypothetical protein
MPQAKEAQEKLRSELGLKAASGESNEDIAIPIRYRKASTSGLTYDVQPGKQTHDIDLKP